MTTLSWHWLTTVLGERKAGSLPTKKRESNSCQNTHCSPLKEKAFHFLLWSVPLTRSYVGCILRWSCFCSLLAKRCRHSFLLSWASASGAFPSISSFVWRSIFPCIIYAYNLGDSTLMTSLKGQIHFLSSGRKTHFRIFSCCFTCCLARTNKWMIPTNIWVKVFYYFWPQQSTCKAIILHWYKISVRYETLTNSIITLINSISEIT